MSVVPFEQVLYTDSAYDTALGYLPRELAQYLSPLMEMFNLSFEVMELA